MTTTETDVGTDVAATTSPSDAMERFKAHVAKLSVDDPETVAQRIIANIIGADNPTDLLNAGSSIPAATIIGQPIIVDAIRASESTMADGQDWYLHVDARFASNGQAFTFSSGSADVSAKLVKADMEGWFPLRCKIEQATKATAAGYFPLFLRPLDKDDQPF